MQVLELFKAIWQITAVKLFMLSVVLLTSVWALFYVATHGRVVIEGKSSEIVTIQDKDLTPKDQVEFEGDSKTVVSGTYLVRNDQDGRLRVAKVEVKGWLQTSRVSFEQTVSKPVSKVASLTAGTVFGSPGSYKSVDLNLDSNSKYVKHLSTDAFGSKNQEIDVPQNQQISKVTVIDANTLAGIVNDPVTRQRGVGTFDTNSGKRVILPFNLGLEDEKEADVWSAKGERESDFLAYQDGQKNAYYFFGQTKKDLPVDGIARFGKKPLLDANDKFTASVTGNDYKATDVDKEGKGEKDKDTFITVKDTSNGTQVSKFQIPSSHLITDIAVSSEGNVALVDNNQIWVYKKDGTYVLSDPYSTTNTFGWKSGHELITASVDSGMHLIDVSKSSLSTLFQVKNLSISDIVITTGGVFFTAYSDNDYGSELPDGYFVDFGSVSKISSDEYMKMVSKLPLFKDEYEAGLIGNKIVVRVFMLASDNVNSPSFKAYADNTKETARAELKRSVGQDIVNKFEFTTITQKD